MMNAIKVTIYMTLYVLLTAILIRRSLVIGVVWAITLPLRWALYNWIDRKRSK